MFSQKLVLEYVFLVGLPLVGLLGILRAGQHLTPPISVAGAWNVDADLSALASAGYGQLLTGARQPFLTISQSGTSLVFSLNNPQRTTLSGTIHDTTLTIGPEHSEGFEGTGGHCGDPRAIYLKAVVYKQGGQRVLTGILGIRSCEKCVPVSFRAVRQVLSGRGGR